MAIHHLSIFISLLLMLLVTTAFASAESPFIIAHKKITVTKLKSGAENVAVAVDLYNKGLMTAYDVSLNDDSWAQDFFDVVSGNSSSVWEKLDPETKLSHSFVLHSKRKGIFYGSPAVIRFRVPSRAIVQEAYSNPILPMDILAERPPEKKLELAKRVFSSHGPLLSVLLLVALFGFMIIRPSKSTLTAKGSKKKR